jgi:hypothetical protein
LKRTGSVATHRRRVNLQISAAGSRLANRRDSDKLLSNRQFLKTEMKPAEFYRSLADLMLITHVAFVAFVVVALPLILVGGCCGWKWIRNPWFRSLHLAAIGLVAIQSWLGVVCPLTILEMRLREKAGDTTYEGTFIAHWLQKILFYEAPAWVFITGYTVFGLLVIASWFVFRPRPFGKRIETGSRR